MASKMIGRAACPECGFESAHVKQSDKCVYRYCPECGAQHHARTDRQRADLLKKTRLVDAPPEPGPTGSDPATPPEPSPTPAAIEPTPTPTQAAPARRRLFG